LSGDAASLGGISFFSCDPTLLFFTPIEVRDEK
jgi:hypothetical protein